MSLPDDTQMDKDNILLFGLTACALGLSLFIFWGPKLSRRSSNYCSLIGLQNLGLTCFLNALLQALASCPSFIEWLRTNESNGTVSEALFAVLKLLCYEREANQVEDVFSPDDLIRNLRKKVWPVFPQEQDPHELFLHLLSALEEEELKSTTERSESLLDALAPEDPKNVTGVVSNHGDALFKKNPSASVPEKNKVAPSPFRGYLASQLSCQKCGKESAVYDKFDSLTLALPPRENGSKLQKLLREFVSKETVDGFVCDHCNKGRDPSTPPLLSQASKAIKIGKLPKCLCLHISRTYIDPTGLMYKRESYVDFPEYLPMSKYTHTNSMINERKLRKSLASSIPSTIKFPKGTVSEKVVGDSESHATLTKYKTLSSPERSFQSKATTSNPETQIGVCPEQAIKTPLTNGELPSKPSGPIYRLKAVVEHRGTVDSGHFVTYRRGPLQSGTRHRSCELLNQSESRWYFTSDEVVKKSSLSEALSANAYLLFYEKCSVDVGLRPIDYL